MDKKHKKDITGVWMSERSLPEAVVKEYIKTAKQAGYGGVKFLSYDDKFQESWFEITWTRKRRQG